MQHWEIVANKQYVIDTTAEELMENAFSYFKFCDDNPIIIKKTITSGKGVGGKADVEQTRPYTIKGLCLHCGISEEYLRDLMAMKGKDSEYALAIQKIGDIIFTQNLEMAMINEFNPVITAKILKMDLGDTTSPSAIKVEIVQGLPPLSNSENEVLKKLDSENRGGENTEEQSF